MRLSFFKASNVYLTDSLSCTENPLHRHLETVQNSREILQRVEPTSNCRVNYNKWMKRKLEDEL